MKISFVWKVRLDCFQTVGRLNCLFRPTWHPTSAKKNKTHKSRKKVPASSDWTLLSSFLWTPNYFNPIFSFSAYASLFDPIIDDFVSFFVKSWTVKMCWKHFSSQHQASFQSWSFKVHDLAPFVFVLFISKKIIMLKTSAKKVVFFTRFHRCIKLCYFEKIS